MGSVSVPSPTGGWNARDSLDAMESTDAVKLINWIPRAGYCESRRGTQLHVTGLGGTVESVIPFRGASSSKLLGAANSKIWDISTTGAPSSIKSGLTNNLWQYDHHSGKVIMTNGQDTPQVYDGAAITDIVVTGVTATTLWGIAVFKGRAFYWAQDAQKFWYAAAGAYQGALSAFDLAPFCNSGGSLVQVLSWTLDAGDGVDDLAAFVFSTGEVLVYQGDDPGDATKWALVGRFKIGEPLGIRAHARVGSTEIIATKDGYLDLAKAIRDGRYSEKSTYSHKIIRAAKDAATQYGINEGWFCLLYPAGNLFLVNVPQSSTTSVQHVRDTTNAGWTQFQGWNMRAAAVHEDKLYFGTSTGDVYLCDVGIDDNGSAIYLEAVPAFNSLGSRARRKSITAVSVVSNYVYPAKWALDGLADFNMMTRSTVLTDSPSGSGASAWDTSPWDTTPWATSSYDISAQPRAWRNLRAAGYTVTCSVRLNSKAQSIVWFSTAYLFKNLGAI